MCASRICVKSHGSLTMIRILLMLEECDWLGGNPRNRASPSTSFSHLLILSGSVKLQLFTIDCS